MEYKSNKNLLTELENSKVNMITTKSKRNYLKLLNDKLIPMWSEVNEKEINLHKLLLNGPLPFISFLKANFDMTLASRIRIAVMSLFIHTSLNDLHELLSVWKHELNKVFQNVNMEHCTQNMPSQKDMKALLINDESTDKKYIDQEYIRQIYHKLKNGDDDKLYLSFMGAAGLPPVRSTDCHKVHLSTGESECANYIDMSTIPYNFILRDYKTAKLYKTKTIPLLKEICYQIDTSLEKRPRQYLFVNPETKQLFADRSSFGKYANLMLRRCFGNNFSGGRLLRHTYVSDADLDFRNLNNIERTNIANVMGNTQDTIQFNYLYEDSSKWIMKEDTKYDTGDEKDNVDLQAYSKSRTCLNDVLMNASKMKDEYSIPVLMYATNPLCVKPLNMKGNSLPLLALWNCDILKERESYKNQSNFIRLYENEPVLVITNDNQPDREYLITDINLIHILNNTKETKLCVYKNSQYFYKVLANILRDTSFFPKISKEYSLNNLQKDAIFVSICEKKDGDLKNRKIETKTKKKRRIKKKRTKSQK